MRLIIASIIIIHFYTSYASLIEKIFSMYGEPFIRFNRSGYPKFPSTQSITCGMRTIDFIPERAPKIVGGVQPPYGAYPWLVDIKVFRPENQKFGHHCGGAIIGPRLVLTAAHCIQAPILPEHLRAVVGEYRLKEMDEHEAYYKVEKVVPHPDFRKVGPYSHDIAILKLGGPGIKFSAFVSPICLPEAEESPPPGTWCTVSGWGASNSSDVDTISPTLLSALVPVLSSNVCRRAEVYGQRSQPILDSMVCAGRLDGGVDACAGDSGGPLACPQPQRYALAGLVSWGDGCAQPNRPGVYTRVGSYTGWVRRVADMLGVAIS